MFDSIGVISVEWELCGDEQLLTFHLTGNKPLLQYLPQHRLVSIQVGRVKVSVTDLEGNLNGGFQRDGVARLNTVI